MSRKNKNKKKYPPICLKGGHSIDQQYSTIDCRNTECTPWYINKK